MNRFTPKELAASLWSDDALLVGMRRLWGGGVHERAPCSNGLRLAKIADICAVLVCSKLRRLTDAISVRVCGAAALVILSVLGTSLAVAEQPYIERPYLIEGRFQLDPVGKTPEPTAPQGKSWSMPSDYPAPKLVPAAPDVGCRKIWEGRCTWERINHGHRVPKSKNA